MFANNWLSPSPHPEDGASEAFVKLQQIQFWELLLVLKEELTISSKDQMDLAGATGPSRWRNISQQR